MGYLYGDSTPFPLNENFIETLRGATDACFALLQADEAMEHIRSQSDQEKRSAEQDIVGVERLAAALNEAMAPYQLDRESPYVAEVFARLMGSSRGVSSRPRVMSSVAEMRR